MSMSTAVKMRPEIGFYDGKLRHNGEMCTFRINRRERTVQVGCTDVSFSALSFVYEKVKPYLAEAEPNEIVVQP